MALSFSTSLLTNPTTVNRRSFTRTTTASLQTQTNNFTNLLKSTTKLLWGSSLPPNFLISTVRTTWESTWQLMMSQLAPSDPSGSYTRPTSQFRSTITILPLTPKKSLHLYVGLPCPWAHRTLIVRALKGLEDAVPVSIAQPAKDGAWQFGDVDHSDSDDGVNNNGRNVILPSKDLANGCRNLREVYVMRKGGYSGRTTVPMLWEAEKKEVVCNESYDIIEFFNSGLNELAKNASLDLSPVELKGKIEEWNSVVYPNVNNGVYRCGFAQSQLAYDTAVNDLFNTLNMIDDHLGSNRYLCGDTLTLADVCLFTTLIRFDIVYNVLFKCTEKKLIEYPNLHGYMRDIYQIPKVAATCNFTAIMDGYYKILFPLNPGNIRPVMPSGSKHEFLSRPHDREQLSLVDKTEDLVRS